MSKDNITAAEPDSTLSEREIYEVRSFADKLGISFGMAKHLIEEREDSGLSPNATKPREAPPPCPTPPHE